MTAFHFRAVIFIMVLVFTNSNAMSDEDVSSEASKWDSYLKSVDQYTTESDETPPAKTNIESKTPARTALKPKPKPLENGATPQQVSEYNQKLQKALRDQQKQETENLYETVNDVGQTPAEKPAKRAKPLATSTPKSVDLSGYSAKKVNFKWGGKVSEYEYTDYEIVFESTNAEHTEKMITAMNEMTKSGWEVDLNRSFQRVDGNDEKARAFTTTQMRFRRRK